MLRSIRTCNVIVTKSRITAIPPSTATRKITIPDDGVESLFGSYDENLKHLETLFNVRIRTNGHEVIVEGTGGRRASERVLEQLAGLLRGGYKLAKGDVKTAAQLVAQDDQVELADISSAARRARPASVRCCPRASTSAGISTPSTSTTSSSGSARRAPARRIWRWRRR